jgi:NHL repeat-containing protein
MPRLAFLLVLIVAAPLLAHPAWGIVVNRAGEVYYSDLETVWKIDAAGRRSVARPGVSGRHVHELAIDDAGNVYGQDYDGTSNRTWKLSPDGKVAFIRGAMWRDRHGNAYEVDENEHLRQQTRIMKNGTTVLAGGRFGHADGKGARAMFGHIAAMTIAPDQSIYVTDDPFVRRVTLDGVVTTVAKDLDRPAAKNAIDFGYPMGLAVAPNGDVYVADFRNRRVLKIVRGVPSTFATSAPPYSPTGVAIGPRGEVWVLESGFRQPGTWLAPRVRKLR